VNKQISDFARNTLKEKLPKLPQGWQDKFKLMYGRGNHENLTSKNSSMRTPEEAKALTIDEVVNEMPDDKLDWAMQQVENSLKKLEVTNG